MDFSPWEIKFYDFLDKLPFDLALYHPHAVHFAVALPIIAFIFQWLSISSPDKGYQSSSNLLFYLGVLFIILAFITGKAAGPDVKPTLSIAGQDLFDTHKEIGTYLTVAFMLLMVLKLFSSKIKHEGAKNIVMILMVVALVGLFYEIKSGHELVYDYGAGTEMQYVN
ncbi:MAG TPA: hypothetical protein EYH01_02960 [Campylobacterales bacterium]|nr:hypothetical protein [Campylobacterales bacterium]